MTEQTSGPAQAAIARKYRVFASDYDGTLASQGTVSEKALEAIHSVREAGYAFVLVTGRILEELKHVFPGYHLCDWIVAENGPVIYNPGTEQEILLASAPPDEFVVELRHRDVLPLDLGRVIVATREPHDAEVLEVIRELGLELQVIFNKGAVMVLPAGMNKGVGLAAVLKQLGVEPAEVVAVGDAENDHSLLRLSGFSAAVSNALPALKERADYVLEGRSTDGVIELLNHLLSDGLASLQEHVKPRGEAEPTIAVVAPVDAEAKPQ